MKTILIPVSKDAPHDKLKSWVTNNIKKGIYKLHLIRMGSALTAKEYREIMEDALHPERKKAEELKKSEEASLEAYADEFRKEGYKVNTSVPLGLFHQKFAEMCNEIKPAYVLMITSGSSNVIEDILGTNTSSVYEKINCPMIVIPHHTTPTKFTMATVGLDMEDHGIESLKSFFEFADELEIDCSYIKIENRLQMDIINDEIILARLQKKYPGRIDHIVHRPADDISDGLEKYAAESKSNLIVLFSTHKNFIERLFDKSITKDLILHSKTSLLIYRY